MTSTRVAGLLFGVSVLAVEARRGGWLTGIDRSVTSWLMVHRNPAIDHLALVFTNSVGPVEIAVLSSIAAAVDGMRLRSTRFGILAVAVGLVVAGVLLGAAAVTIGATSLRLLAEPAVAIPTGKAMA